MGSLHGYDEVMYQVMYQGSGGLHPLQAIIGTIWSRLSENLAVYNKCMGLRANGPQWLS